MTQNHPPATRRSFAGQVVPGSGTTLNAAVMVAMGLSSGGLLILAGFCLAVSLDGAF
ncbi:MAG: hypothetical protein OEY05_00965 [Paracoccaceae bacterium]|nr:hypothetical protein [Paracoccaceae bacterium]MDH5528580.1 hypothetical protein [Paracoccaceae bacterium]